eukprot:m.112928 g.112928  ORF g.112928 m.112928 type:complete len:231 (-) comp51850_c1_seq3:439-1131(-)
MRELCSHALLVAALATTVVFLAQASTQHEHKLCVNLLLRPLASAHPLARFNMPAFPTQVLITFRNAEPELRQFVPFISRFLVLKGIEDFDIIVVNQIDDYRFNKGSLYNIAALYASNYSCDYYVLHDIDLLPLTNELPYEFPAKAPMHLIPWFLRPGHGTIKPAIPNSGGVIAVTAAHYKMVGGLSNKFWGWGKVGHISFSLFDRFVTPPVKFQRALTCRRMTIFLPGVV